MYLIKQNGLEHSGNRMDSLTNNSLKVFLFFNSGGGMLFYANFANFGHNLNAMFFSLIITKPRLG